MMKQKQYIKEALSKISKLIDIIDRMEEIPIDEINKISHNSCGAYIIAFKSDNIYVGKSKNIRARIPQHKSKNADEFKGEKMDKASAYLTKDYYDAGVLEAWLIRELKPGLNKEHLDNASTWKEEVPVEKLLEKTTENIQNIFMKLSKKICCISSSIKEKHVKSGWITYQTSPLRNFCIIRVRKEYLQIDLKVDRNNFDDPDKLSHEIEWTTSQAFNRRVEMYNYEQIDGIINLIKQAYHFLNRSGKKII